MLFSTRVCQPDRSSKLVQHVAIISWPSPSEPDNSTASCVT